MRKCVKKINGVNYVWKGSYVRDAGNAHFDAENDIFIGCAHNITKYGTATKYYPAYTLHKVYVRE